jgi:polyphosphate:AMP phosphotransferase
MRAASDENARMDKETWESRMSELRGALLDAQRALSSYGGNPRPVLVILAGLDGAGRSEMLNRLHEILDARGLQVLAYDTPSDEEEARPRFWRYWRGLPARGRIAVMQGGWYASGIEERVMRRLSRKGLVRLMRRIVRTERALVQDGLVLVKLFFRISKADQKETLHRLESAPETAWRVSGRDWKRHRKYDRYSKAWELALQETDLPGQEWTEVSSACPRHREVTAAEVLLQAMQDAAAGVDPAPSDYESAPWRVDSPALQALDMEARIDKDVYAEQLADLQGDISDLTWAARRRGRSSVVVLEGWDAAGKGGAIRRLNAAIDARLSQVISIAAPTDEEKAHHYLWRFWRHLPKAGHVTIYDRSWYGRVLVERVEGFATTPEWQRAYAEINEFERQLSDREITLVKCFLHVTQDEQLRRFEERQATPWKQHKITSEDWRNREKWSEYEQAIDEMVGRTHTTWSPWTLVAANDKRLGRLAVLTAVRNALRAV